MERVLCYNGVMYEMKLERYAGAPCNTPSFKLTQLTSTMEDTQQAMELKLMLKKMMHERIYLPRQSYRY